MEHLFFNSDDSLHTISIALGKLFGACPEVGESKNVLSESYFEMSILGIKVRLEENCYDYEDQFGFMLSFKRDVLQEVVVRDDDVFSVARIAQRLLTDNLGLTALLEVGAALEECPPI